MVVLANRTIMALEGPAAVHSFVRDDYMAKGKEMTLPGGFECYIVTSVDVQAPPSGSEQAASYSFFPKPPASSLNLSLPPTSNKGVILFPDMRGWAGGRTRAIADYMAFGVADFVLVPKLLVPPIGRGTDGDGLPPEFNVPNQQEELGTWLKSFNWETNLKHKVHAAVTHLQTLGACKIAALGYSFGSMLATLLAREDSKISCLVLAHPSLQLSQKFWDGPDPVEMASGVSVPTLLIPARDDDETYRPGGAVMEAFRSKNLESQSIPFVEMKHGFICKGNIQQATVNRDVKHALNLTVSFLQDQFAKAPRLRLTYFPIPGRAEMTRLTLMVAGIPFEDRRVTTEEWAQIKRSGESYLNQLPMLDVDGHTICQSKAIVRFAGQLGGLYPTDPFQAAQVDMILDMLFDRLQLFTPTLNIAHEEAQVAARQQVLESERFVKITSHLDQKVLSNFGGFVVGPSLTIADLALFADNSALSGGWVKGIDSSFLESYKGLRKHRNFVASLPEIKRCYAQAEGVRLHFKPDPIVIGYWSCQGMAAGLRMMAMFAGAPIQVENFSLISQGDGFSGKEWFTKKAQMKLKNPLSNLPFIIDGEMIVCQSNACYSYMGRKFGLWGKTIRDEIRCEELLCELQDLRTPYEQFLNSKHADCKLAAQDLLSKLTRTDGELLKFEQTLADSIQSGGTGSHLVVGHVTAPDFHLFTLLTALEALSGNYGIGSPTSSLPLLRAFMAKFANLPENQRYLTSPLHTELPFNNKDACFGAAPLGETGRPRTESDFENFNGVY